MQVSIFSWFSGLFGFFIKAVPSPESSAWGRTMIFAIIFPELIGQNDSHNKQIGINIAEDNSM